jgi:hypothetical protein
MSQILDHLRWPTMPLAFCAVRQAVQKWKKADGCAEIMRTVVADFDRMSHDLQNQGILGLDQFYAVFSQSPCAMTIPKAPQWPSDGDRV